MLTQGDDGWAEYARRILEREPSPPVDHSEAADNKARKGLRTALGWGKPGAEVPTPAAPTEDADELPPLSIFRM